MDAGAIVGGSTPNRSKSRYILVVVAGICSASLAGLVFNCAGIYLVPVMTTLGCQVSELSIYLTIAAFTMAVTVPFWGNLIERFPVRRLGIIAAVLILATYMFESCATALWQFYVVGLLYGVVMPFFTYLFIPTMINRWFESREGFLIGLCYAFDSIAAIIFNPIGASLIDAFGWAVSYRVFGLIAFALCFPIMLAMKDRPKDVGLPRYRSAKDDPGDAPSEQAGKGVPVLPAAKAMRTLAFWITVFCIVALGLIAGIMQFLASFGTTLPISNGSAMLGATLASSAMIGSTLGKLALGWISDRSVLLGLAIATICGIAGMIGMIFFSGSIPAVIACAFLYGVFFACSAVEPPILTRTVFGLGDFTKIYSRVTMFRSFGSSFGMALWGFCVAAAGYTGLFGIGSISAAAVLVLGIWALALGRSLNKRLGAATGGGEKTD